MSKRKDKEEPEKEGSTPEVAIAISMEEFDAMKAQLAEAQAKTQEYIDAWQRERADFTNFRRRAEADAQQTYRFAAGATIKKFLAVMDDLERALAHRPSDNSWADGIELVYRKYQGILDAEGVTRIDAEGKAFDPNLHEAIMQEPSEEHESGTVIAVLQQGYMHGEKVLRPALVKVAQ
jgi:molecular chaperone GrpE